MGTGYTRNDTPNNIADGNVINASDLDGEFDSIQAAFNASTGHSHDGTTGEGPQIDTGGIANDAVTLGTKTSGNYVATGAVSGVGLSGSASSEGATFTITSNATSANTGSTIVARDASGNFSAGQITGTSFVSSGDMTFGDNDKAIFGAGSDLQIYHDGSNSYVSDQGTGNLKLLAANFVVSNAANNQTIMSGVAGGAVTLNYSNATKLATTSTGVDVTGVITTDGMTTSADINFGDNDKAIFGAGSDLQIYHNGSHSYIDDVGTGNLYIRATNYRLANGDGDELYMTADDDSAVQLYNNNAVKLATTASGVDVTGVITTDGMTTSADINFGDNDKAVFGAGSDLQIYHDGNRSWINDSGTGDLRLVTNGAELALLSGTTSSNEYMIQATKDGAVTMYYDAAAKIATTATGVDVTGGLTTLGTVSTTARDGAIVDYSGSISRFVAGRAGGSYGQWEAHVAGASGVTKRYQIDYDSTTRWYAADGTTERMRITSAGNVGIGTSSINAPLHVQANPTAEFSLWGGGGSFGRSKFNIQSVDDGSSTGKFQITTESTVPSSPELFTITNAGDVGIGTSSPSVRLDTRLGTTTGKVAEFHNSVGYGIGFTVESDGGVNTINSEGNQALAFATNGASNERLRITSAGTVGIGTSSPTHTLDVNGVAKFRVTSAPTWDTNSFLWTQSGFGLNVESYQIKFNSGDSRNERMRITADGKLLLGTTSVTSGILNAVYSGTYGVDLRGPSGASTLQLFFAGATNVGSISTNGTSTAFNTSSDYRLKENVTADWDATTRLKQLNPVRFNFIADADTTVDGFIANEVQDVVPEAISGNYNEVEVWKDGEELPDGVSVGDNKLDDDGNTIPVYQGIDQSKLVPLLVKTIQELEARITALESN